MMAWKITSVYKKLGILASPNSKKLKMGAKKLGILVRFWNFSISHQKKRYFGEF